MHFGVVEILVIAVLIFLLVGYKKLPTAMKSLKEGLDVFKKEKKDGEPASSDSSDSGQT
ncbi:MAG: twin-arginine translocase TatA/TatE family subunit [Lachnospiraceae bacterium]|nr:twin-arginine translocase TatA/TatE family subunit [Lachnospiraceae bacterium]